MPTAGPTQAPTEAPVAPFIDQIDLTLVIDRSNSMNDHDDVCRETLKLNAERGIGNENIYESPSACWELFTDFVLKQAQLIANLTVGKHNDRALGWGSQFPAPAPGQQAKGLRVSVIGFACDPAQRIPIAQTYGVHIDNEEKLKTLVSGLRKSIKPKGGTCPGLAFEKTVRLVEETDVKNYPYQVAILATDGVFYDMPHPQRAIIGLKKYEVTRFSIGIAVPKDLTKTYGLTKEEIQLQKEQLLGFANGIKKRTYNLNQNGFGSLTSIAGSISSILTNEAMQGKTPIKHYTWCGFRKERNCLDGPRKDYCSWVKGSSQWGCRKK